MGWKALTVSDVQFTPAESNMLNAAQAAVNGLSNKLTIVINEFVGAMNANGYPVNQDGTVPDQLRRHITAMAIWTWLRDFPQLKAFKTDERKKAAEDAESIYEKICRKTYGAIESPFGADQQTANWNSNNKLIGRMQPVPPPALQLQQTSSPLYANPNAPSDTVPTNSTNNPGVPTGFVATPGNGFVLLEWDIVPDALSYNVYRGIVAGKETLLISALTAVNYNDTTVTNAQQYYYFVRSVNIVGSSGNSIEIAVTPKSTIV